MCGFFFVFRIKFFGVVTYFYNGISRASQIKLQTIGFSDRQKEKNSHYTRCMYKSTYVYLNVDSTDVYHVHIMVIFLKHRHIASLVVL